MNLDVKDIKLIQNVYPTCNLIERLSKYQLNLYNYHKSRVTSTWLILAKFSLNSLYANTISTIFYNLCLVRCPFEPFDGFAFTSHKEN